MISSDMLELFLQIGRRLRLYLEYTCSHFFSFHSVRFKTSDLASRQEAILTRKESDCVL